uniref:hypothetical protein n=1 Tax=Pseudomonas veronii TaxID=76761 RepID=UPI003C7AE932
HYSFNNPAWGGPLGAGLQSFLLGHQADNRGVVSPSIVVASFLRGSLDVGQRQPLTSRDFIK